jgi:hypothetical protein
MTKKIAISVPDDVADRLSYESNVSAYITDAVRRRMDAERTREMMKSAGFDITEEGLAEAASALDEVRASITPELRVKAQRIRALIAWAREGTAADALEAIDRIQQISQGEEAPRTEAHPTEASQTSKVAA